jgi:hypothetical protein
MIPLARFFLLLGVVFLVIGGMIYLFNWLGLPLGRLPGDIRLARGNLTCLFPLATSILLSLLLTILLNIVLRYLSK